MDISWWTHDIFKIKETPIDLILDTNTVVPLTRWESLTLKPSTSKYKEIQKEESQLLSGVFEKRRNIPTVCYNCHGLSFANRRGWLGKDVEKILREERYQALNDTEILISGDIIAYYEKRGSDLDITHTGIVVAHDEHTLNEYVVNDRIELSVISKWGALGEFLHPYKKNPYYNKDTVLKFFRYQRTVY